MATRPKPRTQRPHKPAPPVIPFPQARTAYGTIHALHAMIHRPPSRVATLEAAWLSGWLHAIAYRPRTDLPFPVPRKAQGPLAITQQHAIAWLAGYDTATADKGALESTTLGIDPASPAAYRSRH